MFAMVRYADAALAMTRTILRAWAVDGRIMLADRLRGRFGIVPIENRHIVRKVNGQLNEACHGTVLIKPWSLMQKLVLSVTYDLIGVGGTGLDHVADHLPCLLAMAVVEILTGDISIALDRTVVLVKDDAFLVTHRCCEVHGVKIAELIFHVFF